MKTPLIGSMSIVLLVLVIYLRIFYVKVVNDTCLYLYINVNLAIYTTPEVSLLEVFLYDTMHVASMNIVIDVNTHVNKHRFNVYQCIMYASHELKHINSVNTLNNHSLSKLLAINSKLNNLYTVSVQMKQVYSVYIHKKRRCTSMSRERWTQMSKGTNISR